MLCIPLCLWISVSESTQYHRLHNLMIVWLVFIHINQLRVSTDMRSSSDCTLCKIVVDVANKIVVSPTQPSGDSLVLNTARG